ncbi:MAG TPA: hypothetical protein PK052_11810 [Anaerohalosphaeraceae bacterium]|nr:hypothetical protein [Anaerohalosphaeraceae bacterium]HPC64806.1 hypothetical protein [Anaerohalosphaeraceae bacterium]
MRHIIEAVLAAGITVFAGNACGRQLETLGRGIVAIPQEVNFRIFY